MLMDPREVFRTEESLKNNHRLWTQQTTLVLKYTYSVLSGISGYPILLYIRIKPGVHQLAKLLQSLCITVQSLRICSLQIQFHSSSGRNLLINPHNAPLYTFSKVKLPHFVNQKQSQADISVVPNQ
jgi:hypothetical protein